MILSLEAAGTEPTLTRAGHIIHYDRGWNAAVEDQATDRAHRIGQHHSVTVHRLITEHTVKETRLNDQHGQVASAPSLAQHADLPRKTSRTGSP
ncbi:hypothetical protein SUDANB15_04462 [Streptomyces sp. enrichment culture]